MAVRQFRLAETVINLASLFMNWVMLVSKTHFSFISPEAFDYLNVIFQISWFLARAHTS